jgi:hypothetical protein
MGANLKGRYNSEMSYMDEGYRKAIKSGLVGSLLLVVTHLATDLVFYWALSKPSLRGWMSQQAASPSQVATGYVSMPSEAIIAGLAVIVGGLLVFVIYLIAGALAAYYLAPRVKSIVDMVTPGVLAGAIAQAASAPFTILFALLMDLYPPYGEPITNVLFWLGSQLISQLVVMLLVAMVLSLLAALVCGALFRALGRNKAAA